jgi:hypothetical protein
VAVDRIGKQDFFPHCLRDGQRALVEVLDIILDPAIEARKDHLDGGVSNARLLENCSQRRPGPFRRPNCLLKPWLAQGPGRVERTAVSGAFESHRPADCGSGLQVRKREAERPLDGAADLEPPGVLLQVGDVEVGQQVVETNRRDVVAESLER